MGEFTENKDRVCVKSGKETPFPTLSSDPYSLVMYGK
jgi:hypothetical protein